MTNIEEQRINSLRKTLSIIHNRAMAWIILALSLMLTVAAYLITQSQMNTRAEERFKFRALEVKQAIVARMEHYEQVLRGSVGLFNASKNVSRNEWESYVTSLGLETTLQGIQGLGYAIPVSPQDKDDVIDGVKNEGFTDFTIKPEGERAEYSTVLYLEPFDWRNKRAFGYDMWSNDMRRQAMTRARDDGVAATSGIITLVQETDSNVQKGFLTYLPVYTSKSTPDNQFERRRYFQGWVYAAFRSGNLMAGILGGSDDQIYFKIYDGEELIEDNLLFSSGKSSATYDARESASFLQKNKIQLQGRPWTIQFSSAGNNLNRSEVNQPIYVLAAGIFIDFLIFYVIFSLHLLNRRANAIASSLEVDQAEAKQRITAQYDLLDLKENEANVFFELAPEAFLMLDESAKIVKANLHAHQTFGYENPQLIGLDIEALIPESKLRAHKGLRDAYLKSPNQRMMGGDSTFSALRRDGSTIDATINLVPIQYDGKQHIVAAIHDISTQKNIERSRESAKQAAEIASRAKSEFVANMSHEIRTPLNAVLGAAQLLKKTSLSEEQNKYLGMIRHAGQSLLEVISDILDFSKIEAGHMELAESPFDLTEVFSRLATIMSVNSGNKDLDLIINISSDIPKLLIGDALRLQQILINLASNAIKFTERGQVVVEISRNDYDDEMCSLHFSIRDTGIGMSDEEQSRLFKAFTQADTSITRRFGGTGLGLVISSQLLELMGGDIKLKSQKEHGTEFYFDLNFPLVSGFSSQGEQSSKLSLPEECKSDGEFVVSQPVHHLLVVAENDEYIASVNSIGKILGWRVSVEKALDRAISVYELAKNNTPIDTVLVSADMPCSSGISFEAMLNKIDLGACHKLVLVAKNSQRGERINAAVISKPFERLIQPLTPSSLADIWDDAEGPYGKNHANGQHLASCVEPLADKKILLVEDNELNRIIACGFLEDFGGVVEVVENGQLAIDKLKEKPEYYDVVLMDIQMPVMDGLTATAIIRREIYLTLPIIAMSAGVLSTEKNRCIDAGMDDFVPKPVDANELLRVILRHIFKSEVNDTVNGTPITDVGLGNDLSIAVSSSLSESGSCSAYESFDPSRVLALTRGKPERLSQVSISLKEFVDSNVTPVLQGRQALQDNNYEQAKFVFHSLKGVVGNYGAVVLKQEIQTLEGEIVSGFSLSALESRLAVVEKELANFIGEAKLWLASARP